MNDMETAGRASRPREATAALIAAVLIGAAPAINGVLTWRPGYEGWPFRALTVQIAVPVLAIELVLPLIAVLALSGLRTTLASLSKPVVLSLACLLALAALNAGFVAVAPGPGAFMTYVNFVHALAALALVWFMREVPGFGMMVLKSVVIGLNLYQAICYLLLFTHPDLSQLDLVYVGIGVTNVRHLGYIGSIGTALGLGLALCSRARREHLLWLGSATISLAFIVWSGSRGGLFALLGLAVAAMLFLPSRRKVFALWRDLAAILFPAVALALIWIPPNENWGLESILARMQNVQDGAKAFTSSRTELWLDAIQLIGQNPWTGYGQAQFRFLAPSALHYYAQPHNFILQFAVDWGLIGLCLASIPMITGFWHGRMASLGGDPTASVALIGAVTLVAYGMIDGTLYHIYPLGVFVMLLTIAAFRDGVKNPRRLACCSYLVVRETGFTACPLTRIS